ARAAHCTTLPCPCTAKAGSQEHTDFPRAWFGWQRDGFLSTCAAHRIGPTARTHRRYGRLLHRWSEGIAAPRSLRPHRLLAWWTGGTGNGPTSVRRGRNNRALGDARRISSHALPVIRTAHPPDCPSSQAWLSRCRRLLGEFVLQTSGWRAPHPRHAARA